MITGKITSTSIVPHKLKKITSQKILFDNSLNTLLIEARTEIAELKGYSSAMPNPLLLLSPAILKESLASSEIENINTTILNVLQGQLFSEGERETPDKEVLRYREAVLWGFNNLRKLSISTRLIKGIHETLLPNDSRGYRTDQNAILNEKTGKIIYVPPVCTELSGLVGDLENFVNLNTTYDPLIKSIIAHYQFESIHPFNDGNGRTGRILMVLELVKEDLLKLPILYISGYINKHRNTYYKCLNNITLKGDWNSYFSFMLEGYRTQAMITKLLLFRIMALLEDYKNDIKLKVPQIYSSDLVELLFTFPIISPVKLSQHLHNSYQTSSKYLQKLEELKFLKSFKLGKYHLYSNTKLINVLNANYLDTPVSKL